MSRKPPRPADTRSMAGIGFEFVSAIVGFTLVGYWADRHFETSPRYLLIGFGLGVIGASYNLIKAVRSVSRSTDDRDRDRQEPGS